MEKQKNVPNNQPGVNSSHMLNGTGLEGETPVYKPCSQVDLSLVRTRVDSGDRTNHVFFFFSMCMIWIWNQEMSGTMLGITLLMFGNKHCSHHFSKPHLEWFLHRPNTHHPIFVRYSAIMLTKGLQTSSKFNKVNTQQQSWQSWQFLYDIYIYISYTNIWRFPEMGVFPNHPF